MAAVRHCCVCPTRGDGHAFMESLGFKQTRVLVRRGFVVPYDANVKLFVFRVSQVCVWPCGCVCIPSEPGVCGCGCGCVCVCVCGCVCGCVCVAVCVWLCVCGCGCDLLLSWRTKQETGSGSLLPVQVRQRVDRLAGRTAAATAQPHTQTTTSHEFSIDAQASTGAGAGAGAGGGEPSGDLTGQHWLVRVSAVVDRLVVTKTADRVRAIADTLKRYAARDDQRALWPHMCRL